LPFSREKASETFFFGFSICFVWIRAKVEKRTGSTQKKGTGYFSSYYISGVRPDTCHSPGRKLQKPFSLAFLYFRLDQGQGRVEVRLNPEKGDKLLFKLLQAK